MDPACLQSCCTPWMLNISVERAVKSAETQIQMCYAFI